MAKEKGFIMQGHSIIVTDTDMDRLRRLALAPKHSLFRDQLQLELLEQTLESAEVMPSERVPRDVIRMSSRIRVLDFDTRKQELYTLVVPENANISTSRISVLAPVGTALLGHRQGDVIETRVPGGTRRLRVEEVWNGPELARKRVPPDRLSKRKLHSGGTVQRTALAA
jgi:regulator of nucleoside diphosphate kinase